MKKLAAVIVIVPAFAFACTEAVQNGDDAGPDVKQNDAASNDVQQGSDVTPQPDASGCGFAQDASALAIVVNEIRAKGAEFVELYNPTSTTLDLGGVQVADTVTDSGCPKTSEALTFPNGTQLAPGAYLVIDTSSGDAGGPFTNCHDAGITCWQATWGISNSSGESVFVLANGVIATSGYYPPSAVDSGLSWGRIPNGTGSFTANVPTPGAANQAAP
jgi:hypothetical protein